VARGWWTYKSHESTIVDRMDQFYLTVSAPGREEYFLEDDETFEVPYMASKLSVEAVPTRILDVKGRLLGEFSSEKRLYVSDPAELPAFLKKALVASEDGTFYEHHGVNWSALVRALWVNARNMRRSQGGSTITQQLAKMMFTTRRKTYGRKIYELFCARKLEAKFTKDQILLMYLDFAYFGHGVFGIESAARYYFGKSARDLDLAECAMLVGIIPNPNRYSPFANLGLAQARHRTVLSRMAKLDFVPASAVEGISADFWKRMSERLKVPETAFWRMRVNEAPYAVEAVRRRLLKDFSKDRLLKGGLKVNTTFDLDLQRAAQDALRRGLAELNARAESGKSTGAVKGIEGALVALDPRDGSVLALVGGSGFNFQNQLIRADSARPIGSSVKPFIFAAAFESGRFKPEDTMEDAPVHYKSGGRTWSPQNYGKKYYGKVTLALALHKSLNSVAIRLLEAVGLDPVIAVVAAASGKAPEAFPRNLTLALGTVDLSAFQLARAYAVFVNEGRPVEPHFIRSIEGRSGEDMTAGEPAAEADADEGAAETPPVPGTAGQGPPPEPPRPVLKPETCRLLLSVMRGVLGPEGSARAAALKTGFNIPAAGKTGTTNDYRDAWFAGVTPDLSAVVWLGHDDMRVPLGYGYAGGAIAAPIWMEFVKAVYRDRPTREFATPGS